MKGHLPGAAFIRRAWHDPVWSKVIAAGIIALVGAVISWITVPHFDWVLVWSFIACVFILFIAGAFGFSIARQQRSAPNIRVIEQNISYVGDQGLGYPLKCHVVLQNQSSEPADVRLSDYQARAVTLKRFPLDVLQVRFQQQWLPVQPVDRVAVYPTQLFQAWVGPDERKFNEAQLNQLRGQIGTLVFLVNERPVQIQL